MGAVLSDLPATQQKLELIKIATVLVYRWKLNPDRSSLYMKIQMPHLALLENFSQLLLASKNLLSKYFSIFFRCFVKNPKLQCFCFFLWGKKKSKWTFSLEVLVSTLAVFHQNLHDGKILTSSSYDLTLNHMNSCDESQSANTLHS